MQHNQSNDKRQNNDQEATSIQFLFTLDRKIVSLIRDIQFLYPLFYRDLSVSDSVVLPRSILANAANRAFSRRSVKSSDRVEDPERKELNKPPPPPAVLLVDPPPSLAPEPVKAAGATCFFDDDDSAQPPLPPPDVDEEPVGSPTGA